MGGLTAVRIARRLTDYAKRGGRRRTGCPAQVQMYLWPHVRALYLSTYGDEELPSGDRDMQTDASLLLVGGFGDAQGVCGRAGGDEQVVGQAVDEHADGAVAVAVLDDGFQAAFDAAGDGTRDVDGGGWQAAGGQDEVAKWRERLV